jgi:predicted nucleic acid-binding protein
LQRWIRLQVPDWFAGRILPIDLEVAVRWGRLTGELRGPMPAIDSLLAATALVHGLKIATRNVEDFATSGVPSLNPWKRSDPAGCQSTRHPFTGRYTTGLGLLFGF